ncbi:MAG: methyltransferase domain-containing protein [Syntrophales bacterium]|nr:methyltransferase domain-containing protein [Syntrophales bacterium]
MGMYLKNFKIRNFIYDWLSIGINEKNRKSWLEKTLIRLPPGSRILDAGAGEMANKVFCKHLEYISQDFCEYKGDGNGRGLQTGKWDTSRVDIVSDITTIPESDSSFDAILCSEVFEHIPEPEKALEEFSRLLKPGGILILTAPFSSLVHMAPYHFVTGFSRYWYEHHLPKRGFKILELMPNGDWYDYIRQEIIRLALIEYKKKSWTWPLAAIYSLLGILYFKIRSQKKAEDLACFGWHCLAIKTNEEKS